MPNIMNKIMTLEEQATKAEVMDRLGQQGYPTYAHLLDKFALHLTEDPEVVAYMIPDKGIIVLNRFLSLNQVSTIVRHEILHQYLEHGKRELAELGLKDIQELQDASIHKLSNIAADYEISNKGYTERDKRIARAIRLNDETVRGLVTEDDHEDWVDLTYEEMFKKLREERKKNGAESSQAKQQVQIGSQGNAEKQKAESIARAAKIAEEQAEQQAQDASSDSERKEAQKEASKAGQAANKAQEIEDKIDQSSGQEGASNADKSSDGAFSDYTLSEQDLEDIKNAIAEIKDLLNDTSVGEKVKRDSAKAIKKERDDKKARKEDQFRNNPLNRFVSSLNGFIEKEIEYIRDRTWKKLNPTYAPTGIMRQGIATSIQRKVPLVQVYYDRSGSWDGDAKKENIGQRGIESLNKYVREGLLKVEKYYFDTRVSTSPSGMGGGTDGTPILENIKATRPDNVIIITDSDISDCRETVVVPGAVWFLFVNGVSDNLKDHLKGKRLNKSFEISA